MGQGVVSLVMRLISTIFVSAMYVAPIPAFTTLGCQARAPAESERSETKHGLEELMKSDIERAREGRIFFSHHSVGQNLMDGVLELSLMAGGSPLKLLSIEQGLSDAGPAWVHGSGGKNGDPKSKVDFFSQTIERHPGLKPKLALMKFCYVDFNPSTDVTALFEYYERALRSLKRAHPEIVFGHVTVPLTVRPTELKWRVFRILGRSVWEDDANVKRHEFNQRLLEAFSADPIFDLARAESTRTDGTRETFVHGAGVFHSLTPGYTDDDGHLNELGRRMVAPEMIRFVARAL